MDGDKPVQMEWDSNWDDWRRLNFSRHDFVPSSSALVDFLHLNYMLLPTIIMKTHSPVHLYAILVIVCVLRQEMEVQQYGY